MPGKCGRVCEHCPAYRENQREAADRTHISETWEKLFLRHIHPERCLCDGCQKPNCEKPRLMNSTCPVRACAFDKQIESCAYCDRFPCSTLSRMGTEMDDAEARTNHNPALEPFFGVRSLTAIRASLSPGEIIRSRPIPLYKLDIFPFPQGLHCTSAEIRGYGFWYLHLNRLLCLPVYSRIDKVHARKWLDRLLGILWVYGVYGEWEYSGLSLEREVFAREALCRLRTALTIPWEYPGLGLGFEQLGTTRLWRLRLHLPDRTEGDVILGCLQNWVRSLHNSGNRDAANRFKRLDMTALECREDVCD